jgi:hypothetical protein
MYQNVGMGQGDTVHIIARNNVFVSGILSVVYTIKVSVITV